MVSLLAQDKYELHFLSFILLATFIANALCLCVIQSAEAGIVYGRVFDATKTFRPGDEIMISGKDPNGNSISVGAKTDAKQGGYSISIPPGLYVVEFRRNGRILKGRIQSFPGPIRQDIYLLEMK